MSGHPEDRHGDSHVVVEAAKDARGGEDKIVTLSTGVRVRLRPVSPSLVAEISASVKYPPVPRFTDESGREMENPTHPDYLRECEEVDTLRSTRVLEAITMFAFELVDGVPDDGWEGYVKLLARRGSIDLEGIDLEDPIDREFAYKKYRAVGNEDLPLAGGMAGIRSADVESASEMFQRNQERGADSDTRDQA
jgi:hypothetical protein